MFSPGMESCWRDRVGEADSVNGLVGRSKCRVGVGTEPEVGAEEPGVAFRVGWCGLGERNRCRVVLTEGVDAPGQDSGG